MEALLGEVGRRLSDRWLVRGVLPGLLWCAALAFTLTLGHDRPFAFDEAWARAREVVDGSDPAWPLAVAAAVLAGGAAGAVAHALGAAVRAVWLGRWRGPAARAAARLAERRRRRASDRLAAAGTELPRAYLPDRPTWIGDRVRLTETRVAAQYGLRLALIWPPLWQLLDADGRALVQDARDRFDRAGTLAGWAILYVALTALWWPALAIGAALGGYAWWRGRQDAALFADTVEAAVDLHHRRLAEALGHPAADRPLDRATADAINDQLHKGASPQPGSPPGQRQLTRTGAVIEEISSPERATVSRERQQVRRPPTPGAV
jgi:hypothetical protein